MTAQVQILLSIYNGELWLGELLESLERQSFSDWELLVRDDGSSDQSYELIRQWQYDFPSKLSYLQRGEALGSMASFEQLIEKSRAPYLMFCDQDDVWFPEKIELSLAAVQALEAQYGSDLPLLAHTDMAVVSSERKLLVASFWHWRGFRLDQPAKDYLLTNTVSGCASLFNRSAADWAFPLPKGAIQHDRWLALVCAWFGHIEPIAQPLLYYRQHENNLIGAAKPTLSNHNTAQRLQAWSQQAEVFAQRFATQLTPKDYDLIAALGQIRHLSGWQRRRQLLRYRFFKQGLLANLALWIWA